MDVSSLRNAAGQRLDATWHDASAPQQYGPSGKAYLSVIGHGVTANKDREWACCLAETLSAHGYAALRFSFSGNGNSEGRFEDSCPSQEVRDLRAVLDATEDHEVIYLGHSMGAAVGVLLAAQDARIRKLASLGGMVETSAFATRKFGDLRPGQDCMWEKPECPLSQDFLDDMHAIGSVLPQAKQIQVPWLLLHGNADTVVPLAESERIVIEVEPTPTLQVLDGADHVFSGSSSQAMAEMVLNWLRA